ncbi:hypothetical protein Glove_382g48 [Diversispora epigaea]|uniref:Uncharacterized protein n=1 Tax=Diversispora epigaea TaxID=1348612 RepID=A0A397H7H8_9GLOM|nr:hypothetical protein Glove_382g48 [Diversispora epigaea]
MYNASQQLIVTINNEEDDSGLEEMIKLGLIVNESEQDTSYTTSNVIQVNSTDQDNINKITDTQERGTNPIVIDDDEQDTDKQDIVQSLLEELSTLVMSTSIKGETVEAIIDEDENNKNSAPKNLSILY